jgi:uncharacterized protein (DUF952 family)
MRWLYHISRSRDIAEIAPSHGEPFVHCSFARDVVVSAALYFSGDANVQLFQIDPRRLGGELLKVEDTPRGPMPHVYATIPRDAIVAVHPLAAALSLPDQIPGSDAASPFSNCGSGSAR